MKVYSVVKDSEIEWMGTIPEHWEVKKLKLLGEAITGLTYSPNDVVNKGEGILVLRASNIQNNQIKFENNVYVDTQIPFKLITRKNDILICSRNGSRKLIGKAALIDNQSEGISFGAFTTVFRSDLSEYLFYVFLSPIFEFQIGTFLTSTINQLTIGNLNSLQIPVPSKREQKSIVNYLKVKTKEIDLLLNQKQLLISLLEQQRQSIITEAVTKGLNPNVKMKDSGVEWIGEIPEHWDVNKIKFKFDIRKFIQPSENPTVLSLTQRGLKIKDLKDFSGQHAESYDKYQKVEFKDYVMNGMDLLTGYVDCSPFEGVTSPDYRVFRIKDNTECHDYYLRYFQMCYFTKIFYGHGQGVSNFGRWRLQTDVFKEFPIPVPPKNEQFEVSKYLKTKESEIDKSLELIKLDIEKLKEYRQALIYEAVTGKIDVRDMELD